MKIAAKFSAVLLALLLAQGALGQWQGSGGSSGGACLLVLGAPEWAVWLAVGVVVWAVMRGTR